MVVNLKWLKEIFQYSPTSKSLNVTVLTILCKSWSIQKVQQSCSNYMIRRATQLVIGRGINYIQITIKVVKVSITVMK
jgi:hypothetical protein